MIARNVDASRVAPEALETHLDQLEQDIGPLINAFVKAGRRFYVVGGWVRDLLIATHLDRGDRGDRDARGDQAARDATDTDTTPLGWHDLDITTDARPDEIKKLLAEWTTTIWTTGITFGTVGGRNGSYIVEITTHRGEQYREASRKPIVEFSDDIATDLARRDFTINAVAIELPSRRLVDPYNGVADLQNRVLRAPSDPVSLLNEDPLRILRAARFAAAFSLHPDPELVQAMSDTCDRLAIVSPERISTELQKLLTVAAPGMGIGLLEQTGCLTHLGILRDAGGTDEAAAARSTAPSTAQSSATAARAAFVDAVPADGLPATSAHDIRWAGLLLLGGHDDKQASELLKALRYPGEVCNNIEATLRALADLNQTAVAAASESAASEPAASEPAASEPAPHARRLLATHGDHLHAAIAVNAAMVSANALGIGAGVSVDDIAGANLLDTIRQIEAAEGAPQLGKPLDGKAVLAISRRHGTELVGPQIGAALTHLLECSYSEGPLTEQRAEALLKEHLEKTYGG